jgi:hypothetical protein
MKTPARSYENKWENSLRSDAIEALYPIGGDPRRGDDDGDATIRPVRYVNIVPISSLVQKPGHLTGVPAVGASTNFTAGPLG